MSERSGPSREEAAASEDGDTGADLVVRAGFNGLSVEYRPTSQQYRYSAVQYSTVQHSTVKYSTDTLTTRPEALYI